MAHYGFSKLKAMFAKKGVSSPGGLASYIGNKKYGKDKMQKAAHEGKPLKESQKKKGY